MNILPAQAMLNSILLVVVIYFAKGQVLDAIEAACTVTP